MSLSEAYPTQNCYNLRARRPWVRVQIPSRLRRDSLLEIESPGRSRRDDLLGPLGLEFGRPQDLQCDQYWVGLGVGYYRVFPSQGQLFSGCLSRRL